MAQGFAGVPARVLRLAVFAAVAVAVSAAILAPPASAQIVNCLNLWSERLDSWGEWTNADGSRGTDLPCEEYEPAETRAKFAEFGTDVHIYVYTPRDPANRAAHPYATRNAPELVRQAMYDSMATLKPAHPGIPMTAVLLPTVADQGETDQEWAWDTLADARGKTPCPISVYLPSLMDFPEGGGTPTPKDPAEVKVTIAHEIYHCYQYHYFSGQMEVYDEDASWWVEGSAEHFANQVYPCADPSWVSSYDRTSPVYRQEDGYQNMAFFGYLAARQGVDLAGLAGMFGSMPTSGGVAEQHRAIAGYDGIGEKFHGFGREFVDKTAPCIGRLLQYGDFPSETIEEFGSIAMSAAPFTVQLHEVLLTKGATYRIRFVPGEGGVPAVANKVSFRKAHDAGNWIAHEGGTVTFTTSCSGDPYLFVATNAGAADGAFAFNIEFERDEAASANSDAVCERRCTRAGWYREVKLDRCLVGQWELAEGGVWEYEKELLTLGFRQDPGAVITSSESGVDGNNSLTILADGTLDYAASRPWLRVAGFSESASGTRTPFDDRISQQVAAGVGAWKASEGELAICDIDTPGGGEFTVQTIEGTNRSNARAHGTQHVRHGRYTYSCDAAELKVSSRPMPIPDIPTLTWTYRRLSAPASGGTGP